MYHFKAAFEGFLVLRRYLEVVDGVLSRDVESVVDRSDRGTFDLTSVVVPRVCPLLEVLN